MSQGADRSSSSLNQAVDACFMGACVVDLITYTPRFPKAGETISGKHFSKGFGGKATNAAVMSAKLGLRVKMLAKLGDDAFGKEYLDYLKRLTIDTDDVFISQESYTPVASICVSDDGQNSIVYVPGTANHLVPSDFESRADRVFSRGKLFVSTFECNPETLLRALQLAKKHQMTTLVNAAPPFTCDFDRTLFAYCDVLCLNESETESLTGTSINSVEDCKESIKKLIDLGCLSAIITMGSKGALYFKRGGKDIAHATARQVVAVDTTGAGDAFVGALAYYLSRHSGLPMEEILRRSCDIATTTTLKRGTQSSYPDRLQLSAALFS